MKKVKIKGITAIKIAVVLAFGLIAVGCASTQITPLSQEEMRLDDPRMPPDRFDRSGDLTWYWLGSQAPELPTEQASILLVSRFVSRLRIDDGRVFTIPRHVSRNSKDLYLTPGKHTLTFTYQEVRDIETGNGTKLGNITISFPDTRMEIVMEPGKQYGIYAIAEDASNKLRVAGLGKAAMEFSTSIIISEPEDHFRGIQRRYNPTGYNPNSQDMYSFDSYTPPSLREAKLRKYLVPYDPVLPFSSQSFIETIGGVYVIGFNGDTVSWGWKDGYSVTIGVPSGSTEIKVKFPNEEKVHTWRIDLIPGCRYVFQPSERYGIERRFAFFAD
jgi:hypothetical protein